MMRLVKYFVRTMVAVVAFLILLSILASSYIFFKEFRIVRQAALAHERAIALAGSKNAVAIAAPIAVINEKARNLNFTSDNPKFRVQVSEIGLAEFAHAVKGKAKVVLGTTYLPKVLLYAHPDIYPSLTSNAGQLRLFVDLIDLGEVSIRYDGEVIGRIPNALTNIASCAWSVLLGALGPVSFPSNVELVAEASSYIPPASISIGGATVVAGFSTKPLTVSVGAKELVTVVSGKNLLVVASPID